MDRREFLRKAGIGSAAAAGLPALEAMLATPAWADHKGGTGFFFVAVSHSTTNTDLLLFSGCGKVGDDGIDGGGSFAHVTPDAAPPFPIVASGHWRAKKLLGFAPLGDPYGTLIAGIATWEAQFKVVTPFSATLGGSVRMVCNIGPAGLSTGEDEGLVVSVPGASQTFVPFVPPLGLTIFTNGFFGG